MARSIFPLSAGIALALTTCFVVPNAGAAAAIKYAEGRILVKPVKGIDDEKLAKILEKSHGRALRKIDGLDVRIVEVPPQAEAKVANALSRHPNILFAELDQLVEAVAITTNDPYVGSQWHLPVMGAGDAWQYANGSGVTVAVCDSGIDMAHPDLAGQVVAGWNVLSNTNDVSDATGHGTKVSGVIAAAANNAIGVASVAPNARIMPIRITNDGWAYFSDMAACVSWAGQRGAKVVNISYSGVAGSATVETAAADLMKKGGVVVVAAGNEGQDMGYPNSRYIFTAAATDSGDNHTSWSGYGAYVDISAPGSGIYTTVSGGGYGGVSGTSFASPNTAATAALVMSANPTLTATDVTSVIANTAKDLGDAGWDPLYGHGRVDAFAAVELAAGASTSDRTAPEVAVANPGSGATVKDLVSVDVQATDAFGVVSVDLLVDGTVVDTEAQADPFNPGVYRFAWDSTKVSDGSHSLTARAKDAANNTGSAQVVTVSVSNADDTSPPTFYAKTPADGTSVSGVMTMSASADDNVAVANVTVSGGGVSCSGTTSASCNLNTRKIPDGTEISVTFTATDTAGNTATEWAKVKVGSATIDTTTTDTNPVKKAPPGKNK